MKLLPRSMRRPRPATRAFRPQPEGLEVRLVLTTMLGITNTKQLVAFDSATPSAIFSFPISGIASGDELWAIDTRPSDGKLYAVGQNSGASTGQLYRLDDFSIARGAILTPVGGTFSLNTRFMDMDFDPVTNRARLVTRSDLNLSIDADTGVATPETNLAFAPGQGFSGTPNVVGIAYNNNVAGATAATLFGYDWDDHVLVTVGNATGIPPSTGQVFKVADLSSAITPEDEDRVGLDIGKDGTAFLLLNSVSNPSNRFRRINLVTGGANSFGDIGVASGVQVRDIAVAPEPRVQMASTAVEVDEAAGTVTVIVTRSGDTVGNLTVNFTTANGTAVAPGDYGGQSGSVIFADGETSKAITIPIVDDTANEGAETFTITLSVPSGSNAVLGAVKSTTVTIRASDNDSVPPAVTAVRAIRVGRGRKAKIQAITVTFSEAMDAGGVAGLGNYQLSVPGAKKRGPSKIVPLSGATYDPATQTITLSLAKPLKKGVRPSIAVQGAGLKDLAGNLFAGGTFAVS